MKTLFRLACLMTALLISSTSPALAEITMKMGNEENVLANLIEGDWVVDLELCKLLKVEPPPFSLSFKMDWNALPQSVLNKLGKDVSFEVYAIGKMEFKQGDQAGQAFPFLLIQHSGNPHVVVFQPRDGDPYGDTESFILMGIRTDDEKPAGPNDRIFVGGDFNNQAMYPLKRAS